jgi:mersacidin/lichenicidin family type 2 lantibiotic
MDVPANIDVNVVENSDNTVHITMPAAPAGHQDLSDEELRAAAGGTIPENPRQRHLSITC